MTSLEMLDMQNSCNRCQIRIAPPRKAKMNTRRVSLNSETPFIDESAVQHKQAKKRGEMKRFGIEILSTVLPLSVATGTYSALFSFCSAWNGAFVKKNVVDIFGNYMFKSSCLFQFL